VRCFNSPSTHPWLARFLAKNGPRASVPQCELGKAGVQFWADTTTDMKQLLDPMHKENPELPRFAFGHSLDRRSHKRTSRTGAVCSKAPIFLGTFGVFTGRSAMRAKAGKDNARILRITWPR
jgi:hypothetical protein